MSLTLRRLALALGVLFCFQIPSALAQEDDGVTEAERAVLLPIAKLRETADDELKEKKYEAAIAKYKEASERLDKSQVRDQLKKDIGQIIHYNWACGLSLTGKKDE